MKIKVTNLGTDETTIYELSRENWAGRRACMDQGLVIMWVPVAVGEIPIITSGRRWEIIKDE